MLVPLPPKSISATTPFTAMPGLACSAVNAATASETTRTCSLFCDIVLLLPSALRNAQVVVGLQCAGTAIAMSGDGPPPTSTIASSAWISSSSAR